MSGITQYVVAERTDVERLSNHGWPLEKWTGCFGFKFFGPDGLGHLYGLVRGGREMWDGFPELAFGKRAWVYGVPDDLIAFLAATDDAALTALAAAWAGRIAVAQSTGHKAPDELLELLRNLRTLSAEAVASGRPVFLWHSLAC